MDPYLASVLGFASATIPGVLVWWLRARAAERAEQITLAASVGRLDAAVHLLQTITDRTIGRLDRLETILRGDLEAARRDILDLRHGLNDLRSLLTRHVEFDHGRAGDGRDSRGD